MKSHPCSEVWGVVAREYTHSNCDYGPPEVIPCMEPMDHFDRRPMLVHGFTFAFDTRVELPDRDAEHPRMLLCWNMYRQVHQSNNNGICATLT